MQYFPSYWLYDVKTQNHVNHLEQLLIATSVFITRRWKTLHPKVVPLLQEARRIRKTTLISNFVDRESERPALTPNDFCNSLPMITATSEPGTTDQPSKEKRKARLCKGKRRHKSCRVKARPLEVQGMINENEDEIGSGHDAVWEKRRNTNSENNNSNEVAEDVASTKKRKRKPPSGGANFSELALGVATQKKRRKERSSGHTNCGDRMQDDAVQTQKTKQQSETNKCIEPMQDSSSHQLSTLCMTTNNEAESFGSSLTMKRKTLPKPSPKQYSKRRVHSESGEEPRSVCSENSVFSGASDGAEVVQNNGVEVDTLGMDDVSSKKSSAIPGSKRKRCMHLSTSQSSRISSPEGFKKISSNKSMEKRRNGSSMQQHRSRKRNEPSEAEDDITLASFLHNKEKRIPSLADEDEMTLSCFLNKKSNKEKHQMVENAHLPILERVYQRRKTKKMPSGLQHCEAKTNCDGPTPENSMFHAIGKQTVVPSDKETGGRGIDVGNETAEVVREPGRISDCEADDISLASFCNKLNKRQPANKSEKLNG
ncbi:hypothetical protein CCACVL1_19129 [Corchorus capsularis]|uniref:Uncharacterized protein n=1 Tax=Corchorus capsularis TaxID=210143 RepID=A0A1R3HI66_COCAP|nr:hypothetical protein CCACVL1_19129 [Corchorus capsularis]